MYEDQEQASAILLLCLGYEQPDQPAYHIRAHDFVALFQPFGILRKIIIFSKNPVLKAFIEFADIKFARFARDCLHNSVLNNFASIRLFFSNRESITCPGRFIDYWDSDKHIDDTTSRLSLNSSSDRKSSFCPYEQQTTYRTTENSSPENMRGF